VEASVPRGHPDGVPGALRERDEAGGRGFRPDPPYGNIGDRKCDGLYFLEGVVFQVYSPDELKQAQVARKIEEDLAKPK
jgi:hypothetical protein